LEELNIKDGEMIALLISDEETQSQPQSSQRGGQTQSSGAPAGAMNSPAQIENMRQACLRDPGQLERIRQQQPDLANAVHDQQRFKEVFEGLLGAERDRERERQNQMRLLNEDPFNVDAQRKIEEIIRQDRVMENLQHAYEHNPEGQSVTRSCVLYHILTQHSLWSCDHALHQLRSQRTSSQGIC